MTDQLQVCRNILVLEIAAPQDGADQWIKIFPKGTTTAHDGRVFHLADANKVIAASKRNVVDMVVDREHANVLAPKGTAVPAAGWIKELASRDDGIYGRTEWTPAARQQLKDREFRYISPTFTRDEKGNVMQIICASLVNIPAMDMPAVASAQAGQHQPQLEKTKMDPTLVAICAVLGLAQTVAPEMIVQRVTALQKQQTDIAATFGCSAEAGAQVILAAATKKFEPDLKEFVPMKAFTEVQTELASLKNNVAKSAAETAVNNAVKEGKLPPALKEWGLQLAGKDMQGFEDYLAKVPVIAGGETKPRKRDAGDEKQEIASMTLAPHEIAAAKLMGVSEESFKKSKLQVAAQDTEDGRGDEVAA